MWFQAKKPVNTDSGKIESILNRATEDVLVKENLEKKLRSGKSLRIKLGIDPTGPKIHLGRAAVLRKLKAFQDLGHQIILIIGDFTAQIGDPSDKLGKRPMLTEEMINENLKDYKNQVGKILDIKSVEFRHNSEWLSELSLMDFLNLQECFSVSQMIERRNFKDRFEKGDEISLRETSYPLMQGYDSVAVKADVEIGGFDQLFNLKAGRVIQKYYGQAEQDVLTVEMLPGTDGRKMSTSWGNVINITDTASDMYGKIMAIHDELITKYFLLATDVSEAKIEEVEARLSDGTNPKDLKMELAREIVALYHGGVEAKNAEEKFISVFSNRNLPEDVQEIEAGDGNELRKILVENKIISSNSEFSRLIEQGAIENMTENEKISDLKTTINQTATYRIGKKIFVKIICS